MANFTERAIVQSLLELLEEKSIDRITVKDITNRCDISRNTFYYHYHDIYEVLEVFIVTHTEVLFSKYEDNQDWEGGFEDILEFIYRNKAVINNIYMVVDRSSIRQFLNELIYRHAAIVINKEIAGQEYSSKALDVITDFYKNAFFEAIITWIDEGMKQRPKELATLYSNVFKGTVEAALKSAELTYR